MSNQPENQTMDEAAVTPQKFSVGAVLREAREQQGLSVMDVANRIKFAPRQIEALEADDLSQLPEAAFVRGFLRSYARLLEIDAAPLLASLPQSHAQVSSQAAPLPEKKSVEVPFPSVLAARRSSILLFVGAFVVALLLFILSRVHDSVTTTSAQPVAQGSMETQELALPTASAPVADAMTQAVPPVADVADEKRVAPPAVPASAKAVHELPTKDKNALASSKSVAADKPAAAVAAEVKPAKVKKVAESRAPDMMGPPAPVSQKVAASGVPAATSAADTAGVQIALRMAFDEDSWVDVKDGTGRLMMSRLNHAGSLVRMSGVAPISISIGHAKGVHVYYKGKEFDLAPHIKGETARLVLEK